MPGEDGSLRLTFKATEGGGAPDAAAGLRRYPTLPLSPVDEPPPPGVLLASPPRSPAAPSGPASPVGPIDVGEPVSSPFGGAADAVDAVTPHFSRLTVDKKRGQSEEEGDDDDASPKRCGFGETPVGIRALKHETTTAPPVPGVVVYASAAGVRHDTGASHQESRARLDVLVGPGGVLAGYATVASDFKAPLADVLRVHDAARAPASGERFRERGGEPRKKRKNTLSHRRYVARLKAKCAALGDAHDPKDTPGSFLDSDTRLCRHSLDAALSGCGLAMEAVDAVLLGRARTAFVAARPPGHHAGPRGAVAEPGAFWRAPEMCSCGFCLLNTVAVAAAYARYAHGRRSPTLAAAVRTRPTPHLKTPSARRESDRSAPAGSAA